MFPQHKYYCSILRLHFLKIMQSYFIIEAKCHVFLGETLYSGGLICLSVESGWRIIIIMSSTKFDSYVNKTDVEMRKKSSGHMKI